MLDEFHNKRHSVISVEISSGLIYAMHTVVNPDKLRFLLGQVGDRPAS